MAPAVHLDGSDPSWRHQQPGPKERRLSSFSNPLTEYSPQMEFAPGSIDAEDKSQRSLFDESQELEWASRLLEAADEQQLDRSLYYMIREAGTAAGAALQPADQQAISVVLRQAVHEVLPASMRNGAPMLH